MAIPDMIMERRAVPLADTPAWTKTPARLLGLLCALALAVSSLVAATEPAIAQDVNARIQSIRTSQASTQRSMRALDAQADRLRGQRQAAGRAYQQAKKNLTKVKSGITEAKAALAERRERYARVEAQYPRPELAAAPDIYRERLRLIRVDIRVAENRIRNVNQQIRDAQRLVNAKKSVVNNIDRQRRAVLTRRNGTESVLAGLMKQMTDIARVKAEQQATVDLDSEASAFSWPTTGRITQPYGCTGLVFNPRRGSCKHFHDGIDVASASGTPVRAVAVGVVAYSGWNPYDKEGRAYVVHVVHPDGFTSIYGHLLPTNHVRAGELVHTGQVIGKMGSTGKSTGTHLHFEVIRNGKDVDPTRILPAGVVNVDKTTTKAGQAEKARAADAAKATPTPKPTPKPKPSKTLKYPTVTWEELEAFELCPDLEEGEECDPKDVLARLQGEAGGSPAAPKPYRATSPATS